MKTAKRTILIVFLVLLIILVAVGIWQKDNIKSFINSVRYTETEISKKLEDNAQKMDDIVEKTDYIDVRKGGLTPDEEAAVANGEITKEEAVDIVRGKTTLEKIREEKANSSEKPNSTDNPSDEKTNKPTDKNPDKTTDKPSDKNPDKTTDKTTEKNPDKTTDKTTDKNPDKTTDKVPAEKPKEEPPKEEKPQDGMTDEVSNIVAELYVVKSDFISRLESLGAAMYYEYAEVTNYDRSMVDAIINKNLPAVASLERECDTKINSLLKDLEAALKRGGGDLSLLAKYAIIITKKKV